MTCLGIMGFTQSFTAIIAGSILAVGCQSGAPTATPSTEDTSVVLNPWGPGGSGGTNGFNPLGLHLYKATVHGSMAAPLAQFVPGAGWKIAATAANQLLLIDLTEGRETLEYATKCSLGAGDSVFGGIPAATFPGAGVLTTTTKWKTTPLTHAQKEDLFSCMLAHLNALGVHVPIMLSGPSVTNSPGFDGSAYTFDEALWAAALNYNMDGSPAFDFYVWPSQQLEDYCLSSLAGVLDLRLCGSFLGLCNLTVRSDKETACSQDAGGWTCDGKPAIQTRLRPADVPLLYGICL